MCAAAGQPQLRIKRFNSQGIKDNRILLITGKRGTGKTTMVRWLVYQMRNRFDLAIAIGGTVASLQMFEEFMPKSLVYSLTDISIVEKLVKLAKLAVEHRKPRRILLLLDDFSYRKDLLRQPVFRELFMNGRNFGITLMLSAQYIMDLSPDLRSQIDYVFTFRELIHSNKKRLHEYFYGMIDNYNDFEQILNTFTKNFECLVMDNTEPSGEIEKQIYFYQAPERTPPFTICKPVYWAMDSQCQRSGGAGPGGASSTSNTMFYKKLSEDTAATTRPAASSKKAAAPGLVIKRVDSLQSRRGLI